MPIYEYTCRDCGHEFEVLLRSNDEKPACPACGRGHLTKKFSVVAAHVAGSGPEVCPAKEMGACGMNCGGNRCGLSGM